MPPAGFGGFAADLLVGNFGDGKINAFDPSTGAFLGTLSSFNGPIVNSGLWSLSVRTGGTFNQDAVYFTAGINNQVDGLFGVLTAVTPLTVGITTPGSLPAAQIGTAYAQTLQATGGAAPYSNWTVTAGSLPPGMSLNSSTGTLGGTPVAIGSTFNFMVTVTDSIGATGSAPFQLTIQQPTVPTPLARVGGFAQVASGGGWKTTMTLMNASAASINAQINLYSDAGTPLALSLTFPQFSSSTFGSSVNVILAPNDSIIIASNSPRSSLGWAPTCSPAGHSAATRPSD